MDVRLLVEPWLHSGIVSRKVRQIVRQARHNERVKLSRRFLQQWLRSTNSYIAPSAGPLAK
jgi:hypothetical protein